MLSQMRAFLTNLNYIIVLVISSLIVGEKEKQSEVD
jgi:hypothetical protein